jgi:acetyltransferase-like isoleucine patch superfamily enzyme
VTGASLARRANGVAARLRAALGGARVSLSTRLAISPGGRFNAERGVVLHRHGSIFVDAGATLDIGSGTVIMQGAEIVVLRGATLRIGANAYVGAYCNLRCAGQIEIGSEARLAQFVSLIDADYAMPQAGKPFEEIEPGRISVGPRAWIGCQATVLSGVVIGAGSVVGAGAVVTHDVPQNTVVAGNPARRISPRE